MYSGCRAIVVCDGKIALMERWFYGDHYFVLPGGHIEAGESLEECVVRELKEEFNILVRPIRQVYDLCSGENRRAIFLCEWIEGEISKTDAEEYQEGNIGGRFEPGVFDFSDVDYLNLVPLELKERIILDFMSGKFSGKGVQKINATPRVIDKNKLLKEVLEKTDKKGRKNKKSP